MSFVVSGKRCSLVMFAAALFVCATISLAQFKQTDSTSQSQTLKQTDYVIVTFQDAPAATYDGSIPGYAATRPAQGKKLKVAAPAVQNYLRRLNQGHANFRSFLANSAPKAQVVREYSLVQDAVAVKLNGQSANALANGPGVKSVDYSWLYTPSMDVSVDVIHASNVWPSISGGRANAGAGIKVGVIDSGIDDKHPFFACKGAITHKVYASGKAGNPNNLLVSTHGTHVSGTIGGCVIPIGPPITATNVISGIAPAAELHDYNVFPGFGAGFVSPHLAGSAFSHDIAAALEDTVADGMDVDNMSLGGTVQGPHDFLADAVDATVAAGVVVAVAAGNSGPGAFTIESPGSAADALTAGATTNKHFLGIPVTVGSSSFGAIMGEFGTPFQLSAAYTTTTPANGCTAITSSLMGNIAVIVRGTCSFSTKVRNAQTAGAIGVLMVNNIIGDPIIMGQDGTPNQPTIPAAMLSDVDGAALGASGTATVNSANVSEFVTNNQDIIASFSSRGPTPFTYLIKPDATAPGVNVYSSVFGADPNTDFGFEMFQGTSMATPHLAGSSVLLLQLHPGWSPKDVKSAIVNTAARPIRNATATGLPFAGTLDRGSGRVNVKNATATPLTIDPVSASFGFFNGNVDVSSTLNLAIKNVSGSSQACGVAVTGPSIVSAPVSVALSPGGSTLLALTLSGGQASQTPTGFYDGDVILNCSGTILRAPWLVVVDREAKP